MSHKSEPLFKKGDKIVMLPSEKRWYRNIDGLLKYPADMLSDFQHETIDSEAEWHPYSNHPDGGYWEYNLLEKANPCPEDFLALYDANAEYYDKPKNVV